MGMYTGLRVRVQLQPEWVPPIELLHRVNKLRSGPVIMNCWRAVADRFPELPTIGTWARFDLADFIPFGALSYMPWEESDPEWFRRVRGDIWQFQCSLKNYQREIDHFTRLILIPATLKELECVALYEEGHTWNPLHTLQNGTPVEKGGG